MERETKLLSKRQTKRNIERNMHNLMKEFHSNQKEKACNSISDISHSPISDSINTYLHLDKNIDLDQNLRLNPDLEHVSNNQQQYSDLDSDRESLHTISDISIRHDSLNNITSQIYEESYEDFLTENHSLDSETLPDNLFKKLRSWALAHNITLLALDELLLILKAYHTDIPLTGRSLLHTPKSTISINLYNGKFTYFGICNQIKSLLQKESHSKVIHLDFNFDGLPLFKSNSINVWPILYRSLSFESLHKPLIIGLFTGKGKPEPIDLYLQELIQELSNLLHYGITIGQKLFQVQIRSIICDAPARAFLKRCVSHNSRFGCEKCNVEGEYINHKMTFPCTHGQLQIKDTFNEQKYEEHHKVIMYSLIEFPMGNGQKSEVEVVPNVWLHKKEDEWYCSWPQVMPTKLIRKAIEKTHLPEKNWVDYNCRLLHACDSYNEARNKLVDAEFTSNLESDIEIDKDQRSKRKIKRPYPFYSSSDCDNDEEAFHDKIPPPPKLKTLSNITVCKPSSLTTVSSKHVSSINMNYESSKVTINSPKPLRSVASNDDHSSKTINSPTHLSNVETNYDESLYRTNIPLNHPSNSASNKYEKSSRTLNSSKSRVIL